MHSGTGGVTATPCEWGVYEDVYCAGSEAVFEFLEGVLTEIIDIFPSALFHIGGDEVIPRALAPMTLGTPTASFDPELLRGYLLLCRASVPLPDDPTSIRHSG